MSFTRGLYDVCNYDRRLDESTSVLTHLLDPSRYYNCNECRVQFGTVGGNTVSRYNGNMVDLESDLRGQTRILSDCPERKYQPGTVIQGQSSNGCRPGCGTDGLPCGSLECRKDNLVHLPTCELIQYGPKINNIGYKLQYPECPTLVAYQQKNGTYVPHVQSFKPSRYQGQQGQQLANY